jgi:(1->4)-alpha-D-glucan 1-alpha-D-glucosylmutase
MSAVAESNEGNALPPVPGVPVATVRLQFNKDFTFADARNHLPYFHALGISHLYASPILTARRGSMHGYDTVDYSRVNPELGGEDELHALVTALREYGMGLIVDIVPNHMAVGKNDNRWWLDVLEWGRESPYASFFDIDWDVPDPALSGRVLAPFLGKPYGQALIENEIRLHFDPDEGRFFVAYYDHHFPISPENYAPLLRASGDTAVAALAPMFRDSTSVRRGRTPRRDTFTAARRTLAETVSSSPTGRSSIEALLSQFAAGHDAGSDRLHRLLERQHYRLAWWRTALDEINWRRFFDVIDLAALRTQDNAVFEAVHQTIFRLYANGMIDGVRVDHVDGLADPRSYCRNLRARLARLQPQRPPALRDNPPYIIVEKILAPMERLARDWRVDGTSGYVFMNQVGALLHDSTGESDLAQLWTENSGRSESFAEEEQRARRRILQELLAADFNACALALHTIARSDPATQDWTLGAIRRVLTELLVHFPVYRTYTDIHGRSPADSNTMARAVNAARRTCRRGEEELVTLVDRWLGGEPLPQGSGAVIRRLRARALARFQQLTSPLAAKAVEDTAFYRHGTLLSRNEVGADPAQFSMSPEEFHHACSDRLRRYPHAMLTTATHDHKRGEDVRARLAVLSETPQRWRKVVRSWQQRNASLRSKREDMDGPDSTDEYMLYQMLVGAWPLDLKPTDNAGLASFYERLAVWQQKAIREAKRHSGWIEPNIAYEESCRNFLRRLLDPTRSSDFLAELASFVDTIAAAGAINGLTQTALRMTTPGLPDLYQGCEWWDFSLVDPDNRRPVDFEARKQALASTADAAALLNTWRDGRIKQRLIGRILNTRQRNAILFGSGRYLPLHVRGKHANHVFAFAREQGKQVALVVVMRHSAQLVDAEHGLLPTPQRWESTQVVLPRALRRSDWYDTLHDCPAPAFGAAMPAAQLFSVWPVAFLTSGATASS